MNREFTLVHPEAPASSNAGGGGSRRHWGAAHAEKQRWQGIYLVLLLKERVPQGMEHCTVTATIRWKTKRRRDSTNYIAPIVKPLADVLAPPSHLYVKRAGERVAVPNVAPRWLPDDTDEYFKFAGLDFEYASAGDWSYTDLRIKAELQVRLVARYPEGTQALA